jgi:signal transduction histidine kinase
LRTLLPRSLYGRIALVFAAIVLGLGALLASLAYTAAKRHQDEVLQRVSLALAEHIARQPALMDPTGSDPARTEALFGHLMAVNPNIEVYLLDPDGKVLRASAELGVLARGHVDLGPVRALANGASLPVLGDNPRHAEGREIFSAAPIRGEDGIAGYVYIVLLNDMYRDMVGTAWRGYVLRSSAWIAAAVVALALAAGLAAFAVVTRRLQRLTREVESFAATAQGAPAAEPAATGDGDEIDRLAAAFASMRDRLQVQMAELKRQDELRRELVANVSHDLRTPLTSMQGYLESLARMGDDLSRDEQKQYLDVAVRQSHKVSRLAHQLFELARLECEETLPQPELFSIAELIQDIAQKYALTAQARQIALRTHVDPASRYVRGDIGMIERVIGNLLDNAIRHTPQHGEISLEARTLEKGIEVSVRDTGQGIAVEHLPGLLERGSPLRLMAAQRGGGLGLLIANRILQLHGSCIRAASRVGQGTLVSFVLPIAEAA